MNLNQEFHEHLQAGRVSEAIALVVGQLIELKITTKANSGRLHTTVNLLSGQITNTVDPAFFSDKASQKLLEFHTNQITATAQVVREQLRSLQDLLQALPPTTVVRESESLSTAQPEIIFSSQASETLPIISTVFVDDVSLSAVSDKPETPAVQAVEYLPDENPAVEIHFESASLPANTREFSAIEQSERVKLPEIPPNSQPLSRVGIVSGLAAALANTSALDLSEAGTIPNKFDQALRSAGVRSANEEDLHPFGSNQKTAELIDVQPVIDRPSELLPKRELIDLLSESEEDWDEWLLEEDNILAELSDVTKDRLPDLEAPWLSETGSTVTKSTPSDWEEFMPEHSDVSTAAIKNQANVERFRQNLVNDPQLMSELLAELDDLEEMGDPKP